MKTPENSADNNVLIFVETTEQGWRNIRSLLLDIDCQSGLEFKHLSDDGVIHSTEEHYLPLCNEIIEELCDLLTASQVSIKLGSETWVNTYSVRVGRGRVLGVDEPKIASPAWNYRAKMFGIGLDARSIMLHGEEYISEEVYMKRPLIEDHHWYLMD